MHDSILYSSYASTVMFQSVAVIIVRNVGPSHPEFFVTLGYHLV